MPNQTNNVVCGLAPIEDARVTVPTRRVAVAASNTTAILKGTPVVATGELVQIYTGEFLPGVVAATVGGNITGSAQSILDQNGAFCGGVAASVGGVEMDISYLPSQVYVIDISTDAYTGVTNTQGDILAETGTPPPLPGTPSTNGLESANSQVMLDGTTLSTTGKQLLISGLDDTSAQPDAMTGKFPAYTSLTVTINPAKYLAL